MPRLKRYIQRSFTTVSNEFLRDQELSLVERGLLITLLSLPDGWNMSGRGLAAILPDGRDKVFNTLKKLETKGYLKRENIRENGHFVDVEYQFCDSPVFKEENEKKEKEKDAKKASAKKKKQKEGQLENAKKAQELLSEENIKENKAEFEEAFNSLKGESLKEYIAENVFEKKRIKKETGISDTDFNEIVDVFSKIIEREEKKRSELSKASILDILFLCEKIQDSENKAAIIEEYFLNEELFLK